MPILNLATRLAISTCSSATKPTRMRRTRRSGSPRRTAAGSRSLAPTIFTFENQLASSLGRSWRSCGDGRLAALVTARPVYNRLFWNFTTGPGEVAYALSYGITTRMGYGFINADGREEAVPPGAW